MYFAVIQAIKTTLFLYIRRMYFFQARDRWKQPAAQRMTIPGGMFQQRLARMRVERRIFFPVP